MSKTNIRRTLVFLLGYGLAGAFLAGCVGAPPVLDYTIADTAVQSAQQAGAEKYASNYFDKAVRYYKRAEHLYKLKEYDQSEIYFQKAQRYAERAENRTRLKKFESGEAFP